MSRVGPLMVQTNTTNQNPNNTNQQKPNTTQNKSKPQKKQKHQRKEAISGMLKTSSSHRSEKWCKDGSLCAINPTNKKNLLKTGSAPKSLPSKSWASLVPRSNTGGAHLWESKFYVPFQPQKWAWNKSNNLICRPELTFIRLKNTSVYTIYI